ncbi:hypothetical protein AMECASPLE_025669 [Ameca splendens]|uniref:Uncharacterized protein n=1 Tax=Ameca splendens TaxID=208324 RepID=A0ABV0XHP1_9TELE
MHEHLSCNYHCQLKHPATRLPPKSPSQGMTSVLAGLLSVHCPQYVTDVTGATVGNEKEGLQAICPGSSFERMWWRWWCVQENGMSERGEYSPHCNPAQCGLSYQMTFVMFSIERLGIP